MTAGLRPLAPDPSPTHSALRIAGASDLVPTRFAHDPASALLGGGWMGGVVSERAWARP